MVIGNGNVNGLDPIYFSRSAIPVGAIPQIIERWQIKPGDFVFVFIGRLVKDKGINELVSAFININKSYKHTKLLLVGNYEPDLDPLNPETLKAINKQPNIIHAGYQPDIRPFLSISHALVFPSYREGFPNVPMQAGAMGLPSIVTDINGCNEIIIHEKNGLIIPSKNKSALEEAMIRIMNNKELYDKMVSNARESIVSRYDQKTLWKLIKEEYDKQLMAIGLN